MEATSATVPNQRQMVGREEEMQDYGLHKQTRTEHGHPSCAQASVGQARGERRQRSIHMKLGMKQTKTAGTRPSGAPFQARMDGTLWERDTRTKNRSAAGGGGGTGTGTQNCKR